MVSSGNRERTANLQLNAEVTTNLIFQPFYHDYDVIFIPK